MTLRTDAAPPPDPPPDAPPGAPRPSRWQPRRRPRAGRRAIAAGALVAVGVLACLELPPVRRLAVGLAARLAPPPTSAALRQDIAACQRRDDLPCLKDDWTALLARHPDDANAMANLGIVLNRLDDHAGAVVQFQRAIDAGEGTYDLFAYDADSLRHLHRDDEAIAWSYKALAVVPRLVDVRSSLAKLLVARHRPYEALSLLESYDADAVANGHPEFFTGQRIAIESTLAPDAGASASASASVSVSVSVSRPPRPDALRLPAFAHHFYAPVAGADGLPVAFMVDTGATFTSVGSQWLERAQVRYRVTRESVELRTADGRSMRAQQILIESLRVGPFELHDVPAVACATCAPLLGASALSRFDLRSSHDQGVEFLALAPRIGG